MGQIHPQNTGPINNPVSTGISMKEPERRMTPRLIRLMESICTPARFFLILELTDDRTDIITGLPFKPLLQDHAGILFARNVP